jgi:cell division protein FtsB
MTLARHAQRCARATSRRGQAPLSAKIMREVSDGLQLQTANIKLAKENETLKARVKELEASKIEPKDAAQPAK